MVILIVELFAPVSFAERKLNEDCIRFSGYRTDWPGENRQFQNLSSNQQKKRAILQAIVQESKHAPGHMILSFPRPFKDEALYSLIARHHWLFPLKSLKAAARYSFAVPHATAVVDLPGRLGTLEAQIGDHEIQSVRSLIQNHTLLPLYAPFLPPARVAQLERDMAGNNGSAVHFRAGIMASKIQPPGRLMFCPTCAAEERERTGEAYWHRLHQATGVFICPLHGVFLEESAIERLFRSNRHVFVPAQDVIPECLPRRIEPANPEHRTLLHIAIDAAWLLQHFRAGNELPDLQRQYSNRAMELGYVSGYGQIRWERLLAEFRQRYSIGVLEKLQCPSPTGNSDHWIARILRRPRTVQAPLRHVLLLDFIGMTAEAFFGTETPVPLFGSGPWACENPVCPAFEQLIIREVHLEHSHEHGQPIGVFVCPVCGHMECRLPVGNQESVWTRDYGPIWSAELKALWLNPEVSLRSIATRLGVDPMTVKRHAAKAGLPFPRNGRRLTGKNGPPKIGAPPKSNLEELEKRRMEWLELQRRFPSKSIAELRRLAPACYAYLYRHDQDWLGLHSPRRISSCVRQSRVNWRDRDGAVVQLLAAAKKALLSEAGRPKRISLAALGRRAGVLAWVQKHLLKMPRAKALLVSAVESHTDFARRRIAWAARQLEINSMPIKKWRLLCYARLRPKIAADPGVQMAIQTVINSKTGTKLGLYLSRPTG